ncbi:MAG: hypothetical protein IJH65_11195 [Methanobrevibacter sp.]|nr:hypothetical protein [Methanobrevibacter sp.]
MLARPTVVFIFVAAIVCVFSKFFNEFNAGFDSADDVEQEPDSFEKIQSVSPFTNMRCSF